MNKQLVTNFDEADQVAESRNSMKWTPRLQI